METSQILKAQSTRIEERNQYGRIGIDPASKLIEIFDRRFWIFCIVIQKRDRHNRDIFTATIPYSGIYAVGSLVISEGLCDITLALMYSTTRQQDITMELLHRWDILRYFFGLRDKRRCQSYIIDAEIAFTLKPFRSCRKHVPLANIADALGTSLSIEGGSAGCIRVRLHL